MNMKLTSRRYFWVVLLAFLVACGEQAAALPSETSTPTALPPTPVLTSTLIHPIIAPSPLPLQTQPIIPAITADSIQVERWKEYEAALAKALFPSSFIPGKFLCEWEILGRSDLEVYVWTVCMSIFSVGSAGLPYHGSIPAVIHIQADGSVQSVEIPRAGTNYASDIRQMFPPDAQERYFEGLMHVQELTDHLNWRREHPEEPPLIVLNTNLTP